MRALAALALAMCAGAAAGSSTASYACTEANSNPAAVSRFGAVTYRTRTALLGQHVFFKHTQAGCANSLVNGNVFPESASYCFDNSLQTMFSYRVDDFLALQASSLPVAPNGGTFTLAQSKMYFVKVNPSDPWDDDMAYSRSLYVSCDCGYLLIKHSNDYFCVTFTSGGCPPGWSYVSGAAGSTFYCDTCAAGKYRSLYASTSGATCSDCAPCPNQKRDYCGPTRDPGCQPCRASCAAELVNFPGLVVSSDGYPACKFASSYDVHTCEAYLYYVPICGTIENGLSTYSWNYAGVVGRVSDNLCVPIKDHIAWLQGWTGGCSGASAWVYDVGYSLDFICRTCSTFFTGTSPHFDANTHYIGQCSGGRLRIGSCAARDPADHASAGYYHAQCAGRATTGAVGLGDLRACNLITHQVPGQFVTACGDAVPGLAYADCFTAGAVCPGANFQIACGYHHRESDVSWGLDASFNRMTTWPGDWTRPADTETGRNVIGSVSYAGKCVSCNNWARTACPNDNYFLANCGGTAVNADTWADAGDCVDCGSGTEVLPFCSTSFRNALPPGADWYYTGCRTDPVIHRSPGSMSCSLCADRDCPALQTLEQCGGENPGTCTSCAASSAVHSAALASGKIAFIDTGIEGQVRRPVCVPGRAGTDRRAARRTVSGGASTAPRATPARRPARRRRSATGTSRRAGSISGSACRA
jgi:hypothetical protein